ncbi:hypothetical protein DV738_g5188, partial [Chaetothyriales sp. CBS 135597]
MSEETREESREKGQDITSAVDCSPTGTGFASASTAGQVDLEKQETGEGPEPWKPERSEWLVMITMAVCCLTVALDSTILVPVLSTLAVELQGSTSEAFWTGTSYLLASAVVQPFIAALSDIFGRRSTTIVSVSLFAIASIICGSLFHNMSSIITYLAALVQGLVLFMALYYVSFYMAAAKLKGPIEVGISLLPATALLLPGSIIFSQLITRTGLYRPFMWMGWTTTTLGAGMMTRWGVDTATPYWAASLCVLGLGLGATLSCLTFAVQASTDSALSGSAAAMYAFMRSLGMSLGVAVGGTVFQNLMKVSLREHGLDEQIAIHAESWVSTTLQHLPHLDPVRVAALDACAHGFRGVWITMTAVSGFALLTAFVVKQYSMDHVLERRVEKRAQCSGIRNPGEYAPRSELLTPAGFDRDFNFITSLERGVLVWTVEWISWNGRRRVQNFDERKTLGEAYAMCHPTVARGKKRKRGGGVDEREDEHEKQENPPSMAITTDDYDGTSPLPPDAQQEKDSERKEQPEKEQPEKDQEGKEPENKEQRKEPETESESKEEKEPGRKEQPEARSEPTSEPTPRHIHLYLHRPQTTSKIKCLIPLSTTSTIQEALRGKKIVEFPTIYVRNERPEELPLPFMLESKYLDEAKFLLF